MARLTLLGMPLQWGWMPLHRAARNGHYQVVEQLLGAGAAVDAADKARLPPALPDRWTAARMLSRSTHKTVHGWMGACEEVGGSLAVVLQQGQVAMGEQ
jgi:hypothetical protein